MLKRNNKGGFTLVELIVVITILAILGTIAFISFTKYSGSARDTARKADIKNITSVLDLFRTTKGVYPNPSESHEVVYSGTPIWTQGSFGTGTQQQIGKIFGDLRDPRFGNHYAYATTMSAQEYQLGVIFEQISFGASSPIAHLDGIDGAYASNNPIATYNPLNLTGDSNDLDFWYDGKDVDADGTEDEIDSSIANVGVVNDIAPENFSPFYFDRVIWLDGQDIDGNGNATSPSNGEDVTVWKNKTGAGFDGFVPQVGNNHSNPSNSSAPSFSADAFGTGASGVYFDGQTKGDRIVVDRGEQANGGAFSLAYTFKINDQHNGASYGSAENQGTSHATIISAGPSGGGAYHGIRGGWQLSRDGRLNNFIFRINGTVEERTYFNGADCNRNNGSNSCGNGGNSAEAAFGDWTEINDNQDHTVFLTFDGNLMTGYLDGTKRFELRLSEDSNPFGEYFRFFGNRAGTSYLEGHLGEVFITDEKISLQDIEKIEWYFSNKWGFSLPVGHPYASSPAEMDRFSQTLYSRFSSDGTPLTTFDESAFTASNPTHLNTDTVRLPGSLPGINIDEGNKVHIWKGPIMVSTTGDYTFQTISDDYSFVLIDDVIVVDNGGEHLAQSRSGTINLAAGTIYDFQLVYGNIDNFASLDYRVDGPGIVAYRKYEGYGWNDKSNAGIDLSQVDDTKQPEYNPVKYSFTFQPENYFEFDSDPYSGSDSGEVFAIVEIESNEMLSTVGGNIMENDTGANGQILLGTDGLQAGNAPITGITMTGKNFQVVSYQFNQIGNEQKFFMGGQNFLQSSSDLGTINSNFILGGKTSGFNGEIREILGYSKILTDTERETVEGYLSHKWNIAHKLRSDHEYYEPLDTGEEIYVDVVGNYNGVFVHGNLGDNHLVVASPSILSALPIETGESVDFTTLIGENRLVYPLYTNIPAAYITAEEESERLNSKDGFFFNYNNTKVFEGSKHKLASYEGISEIDANLRTIYTNSYLYEDVSEYFNDDDSDYVKEILGNIIGINPIVPYYCKDILDNSRGINIALTASILGSSGVERSAGIRTVNDGEILVDQDYSFLTNDGDVTDIEMLWGEDKNISMIRVHNGYGEYSKNLWNAKLEVYSDAGALLYEYLFGDTQGVSLIELELDLPVGELARRVLIRGSQDYDEMALREIEVFSGEKAKSGLYKVDDDGLGGKKSYQVYCDMETDQGGWTKVGSNYIYNGSFEEGRHSENWGLGYSSQNNIVTLANPTESPFVLRQTSSYPSTNTSYQLDVLETSAMKANRELQLSAWVRYDGGNVSSADIFDIHVEYEGGEIEMGGVAKTVLTETIGGDIWELKEMRVPLNGNVEQFYWRVGHGIEKNLSKTLYIADINLEIYFK